MRTFEAFIKLAGRRQAQTMAATGSVHRMAVNADGEGFGKFIEGMTKD
jgi:hypothetical protein